MICIISHPANNVHKSRRLFKRSHEVNMETTVDLAGCVGDVSGSKKVGNQIGMCVCPVFETLSSSSPPPLFFASKEIEEFFFFVDPIVSRA